MKLKVMTYNIAGGRDYTSPEKKSLSVQKPAHPSFEKFPLIFAGSTKSTINSREAADLNLLR